MVIDDKVYSKAIDNLLLAMVDTNDKYIAGDVREIIDACIMLGISKFECRLLEEISIEKVVGSIAQKPYNLFYDDGNADAENVLCNIFITKFDAKFSYNIYPAKGAPLWDDEDKRKLKVFASTVFSFDGRSSLMQKIDRLTFFDKELDIPNMAYANKEMIGLLQSQRINDYYVAFCNFKRFSVVNQMYGRKAGNEIMKRYFDKLSDAIGEKSIVFRIGGDNFGVIAHKYDIDTVLKYVSGIEVDFNNGQDKVFQSAIAGIYKCNNETININQALDCATVAYRIAKNLLNETFVFYQEDIANKMSESKMYEMVLHQALVDEEFLVYYQPKVDLKNYRLSGAEALCRWKHEGELIPPFKFIPVFEQSNAICELDFYMLEHVCKDLRKWIDEGKNVVKISVNLSRRHLGNLDLTDKILNIVDEYDIPHEYIEIELTETTTDVDFKDLKRVVYKLLQEGISIAVDDFGIGYSSLNLIREIPWSVIKIDKSFLEKNEEDGNKNEVMLKHVVSLTQDLGMKCIVEGVETAEHVKLLKEKNCFYAQGFYFDKPLPKEEFEDRLINCTL